MILASTDWVGILTVLGTLLPLITGGIIKIVAAINAAHTTASKAAAAADVAAQTAAAAASVVQSIHKNLQLPSNGTTLGAAVEGMAQVQHISVNLQKPEGAPDIPSAIALARSLKPSDADVAPERRATDPPPEAPSGTP